ncbi:toxin [Candidatus Roizmanbacteria bacterium CG07_land_8_20_14_0_80_34_15]|uniref:Toxin n=1 Tax=Candidatus Roizmanbacteria bacterium CG07_land_8_20_14_0_80_34_15 TaxID=1974849 RepID=A0A2M6YSM0_9BACT|nr:MAG: toxin [Candidatus Roizmanbacteria bacterium CG07_land_8_20_14_0_80_34_15]
MNEFRFNEEKDKLLIFQRGFGFKKIINEIEKGNVIEVIKNPNKKKYHNQKMYLIKIEQQIVVVPYVEEINYIFLKTIYPSHKYTRKYLDKKLQVKK